MTEHEPVHLVATPAALASLGRGVTGYALDDRGCPWLFREDAAPLVVTVAGVDLADRFEVFTLSLRTADEVLADAEAAWPMQQAAMEGLRREGIAFPDPPPPAPLVIPASPLPWPYASASIVRVREWSAGAEAVEQGWCSDDALAALGPGEVPRGTVHACWVDAGLLFTGQAGEQLLIAAAAMPYDLQVTTAPDAIAAFTRTCVAVALDA